jgi:hypothetical protein
MSILIDGKVFADEAAAHFAERIEVSPSGCHIWRGPLGGFRAGTFTATTGGRAVQVSAKRFAWAAAHGGINRAQQVQTTCGQRLCVNPAHLACTNDDVRRVSATVDALAAKVEVLAALVEDMTSKAGR